MFNAKGVAISRPDLLSFAKTEAERTHTEFTGCLDWIRAVILRNTLSVRKAATHVKVPEAEFASVSTDFFQ